MRIAVIFAVLFVLAAPAAAHTVFTSPVPRSPSSGLKTGPCGNVAPTDAPTVMNTGDTVLMTWLETVEHPGYYRIAFSPGGDVGYDDNVLLDDIPDTQCTDTPCAYEAQVTLPAEPCEGCSLQLIQYMGVAPPYSMYYSCADITLVDGGPRPDAGPDNPGDGDVAGGCCNAAGHPGAGSLFLSLLVLAVLVRRRVLR